MLGLFCWSLSPAATVLYRSHTGSGADRRIGVRIVVGPPIRTSTRYIGILFTCRHRPSLKVSPWLSGRPPDRCEDRRRIAHLLPFLAFVPSPPPLVTLGLMPALEATAGVSRTGVKDPPWAFVFTTLSRVFLLCKWRGWLTPHPHSWY